SRGVHYSTALYSLQRCGLPRVFNGHPEVNVIGVLRQGLWDDCPVNNSGVQQIGGGLLWIVACEASSKKALVISGQVVDPCSATLDRQECDAQDGDLHSADQLILGAGIRQRRKRFDRFSRD